MDDFLKMKLETAKEKEQYEDMTENALHFSKLSDELIDRVAEIKYRYTSSLISIGIDPTDKDLLEVIADLADALNRTMCDLHDLERNFMILSTRLKRRITNERRRNFKLRNNLRYHST